MAQHPNDNTTKMAQVIAAATPSGGSQSPEMALLVSLLAKKLGKEIEAEEADADQKARARKANADNMVLVHEHERWQQDNCPHMKPGTTRTALAGQKTHRNWMTLVCQYCGKSFSHPPQKPEEALPPHLFPDSSFIGGPQN